MGKGSKSKKTAPRARRGRPAAISNPSTRRRILCAVAAGVADCVAAEAAGISRSTLSGLRSLSRARAGQPGAISDPTISEFLDALSRAEAKAEARLHRLILAHAVKDWRAASFILSRRFPERYGERATITIDAGTRAKLDLVHALEQLTPEQQAHIHAAPTEAEFLTRLRAVVGPEITANLFGEQRR